MNIQNQHKNAETLKGVLKKKYKDLPRYLPIIEYEREFNKEFAKTLTNINKDLIDIFTKQIIKNGKIR